MSQMPDMNGHKSRFTIDWSVNITQVFGIVVLIAGLVSGYTLLRINVDQNTGRIDSIVTERKERDEKFEAALKDIANEVRGLREDLIGMRERESFRDRLGIPYPNTTPRPDTFPRMGYPTEDDGGR